MSTLLTRGYGLNNDPLRLVEQVVHEYEWPCQRHGDDELIVDLDGRFGQYRLWFSWREEMNALRMSCAFDLSAPAEARREVESLVALLNRRLMVGHFNYLPEEAVIYFQHALLLSGGQATNREQVEDLVAIAVSECERAFPAFQLLLDGGRAADEAISAALLETVGEA